MTGHASPFRIALALVVVATAFLFLTDAGDLKHAAGSACTVGEPAGTTCGEAMIRVGYP